MGDPGHNSAASNQLRSFVDRLVHLEEQKRAIMEDIKSVKSEAKGVGFDTKAIGVAVKRAMETAADASARRELEAVTELYLASLGMLDGTPLGDATRKRLMEPPPAAEAPADKPDETRPEGDGDGDDAPPPAEPPNEAPRGAMTAEEIQAARLFGEEAARTGKKVIENPYVAGDPRRAAWDEGWCTAAGSDGMEIPEAWRRKKPKKAAPDKSGGDAE